MIPVIMRFSLVQSVAAQALGRLCGEVQRSDHPLHLPRYEGDAPQNPVWSILFSFLLDAVSPQTQFKHKRSDGSHTVISIRTNGTDNVAVSGGHLHIPLSLPYSRFLVPEDAQPCCNYSGLMGQTSHSWVDRFVSSVSAFIP